MSTIYTLQQFTLGQDLQFGSIVNEDLEGTPGTDIYFGFTGNDSLRGADGDDFLFGENQNDSLDGGAGDDFVSYGDNNYFDSAFAVDNFVGPASLISGANDRQFDLTEWFDVLNVAPVNDPGVDLVIDGGAGANDIASLDFGFSTTAVNFTFTSGATFILPNGVTQVKNAEVLWFRGSTVGDNVTGGGGEDRLYGFGGADVLTGGDGKDFLFGGEGADAMNGGLGDDFIVGTNLFQQFARTGQTLNSYLVGLHTTAELGPVNNSDVLINGGDGVDTALISFAGFGATSFTLTSGGGAVSLPGLGTVIQEIEAIWVIDSANGDNLVGGEFEDHFFTNDGAADTFDGRGGLSDTVELGGAATVNLTTGVNAGAAAGDSYLNIENVIGSLANDSITGEGGANMLAGRLGVDTLSGLGGADTLDGGGGADVLNGGAGVNTASYASSSINVTVDLLNTALNTNEAAGDSYSEIQNLIGTRRGDFLSGDNNANDIDGSLGNDSLVGRGGADTFDASAGSDTVNGGAETDTLVLEGNYLDYAITAQGGGVLLVDTVGGAGRDGSEFVTSVENFIFADQTRTNATIHNIGPESISLSGAQSVDENSPGGTIVGTLTAVDKDGDPITFIEVGDSTLFDVVNNQIRVAAGALVNFEANPSQSITVRANDGQGGTFDRTFTINVNDLNEAPTNITLSNDSVAENSAAGTVVGDLSAIDPDGAGGLAFSIVGTGSPFEIVGDELRVAAGADLDFETDKDIDVTIRVNDGLNSFDKTFTIDIDDVKEPIVGKNNVDDELTGTKADDTIRGLGGDDTLIGGKGADTLDGGKGDDVAAYSLSVTLNLADTSKSTGQAKSDTYKSIESFQLSDGDDTLLGSKGNDSVGGGDGADDMKGGNGADTLSGDGDGDNLAGEVGNDSLSGGSGNDFVDGGDGKDALSGGAGDDTIRSGEGNDRAVGDIGNDNMQGQQGNDFVFGDIGNDSLGGNIGNDTIDGGRGVDLINGDAGNDLITGGSGGDTFIFVGNFGRDKITDFNGSDTIRFDSRDFANFDAVIDKTIESGADLIIRLDKDHQVRLANFDLEDLRANDFDFV